MLRVGRLLLRIQELSLELELLADGRELSKAKYSISTNLQTKIKINHEHSKLVAAHALVSRPPSDSPTDDEWQWHKYNLPAWT